MDGIGSWWAQIKLWSLGIYVGGRSEKQGHVIRIVSMQVPLWFGVTIFVFSVVMFVWTEGQRKVNRICICVDKKKTKPANPSTCRSCPLWQWRRHTGRFRRPVKDRAPLEVARSRSLPWSFYGLFPSWVGVREALLGPRWSWWAPCHGNRPTLSWGEARRPRPSDSGCWKWAWWGWWHQRHWGCPFWMPTLRLNGARCMRKIKYGYCQRAD